MKYLKKFETYKEQLKDESSEKETTKRKAQMELEDESSEKETERRKAQMEEDEDELEGESSESDED